MASYPSINSFLSNLEKNRWKSKSECINDLYPDRTASLDIGEMEKVGNLIVEHPCKNQFLNQKINTKSACTATCIALIEEWNRIRGMEEEEIDWEDSVMTLGGNLYNAWYNRKKKNVYMNENNIELSDVEGVPYADELFQIITRDRSDSYTFSEVFSGILTKSYNINSDPKMNIYDISDALITNLKEAGDFFLMTLRDKPILLWKDDDNTYHLFDSHGHSLFQPDSKAIHLIFSFQIAEIVPVLLKMYYLDEEERRDIEPWARNRFQGFKVVRIEED
jgi:hypothetical protein